MWKTVRAAALAVYETEGALSQAVKTPAGEMPAEQFIAGPIISDALIHTWDLARAIGADETLPEVVCQIQLQSIRAIPETFLRDTGRFKAPIEPSIKADTQTQMLNFTGRQP